MKSVPSELNLELIGSAVEFLKNKILKTPIEYSPQLSDVLDTPVYLKLESHQNTGSFKVRGGLFYLSTLSKEEKKTGVAACSAGNHGLGLAYAASKLGIPCIIYTPKNIDITKKKKLESLHATVIASNFIGYDETLVWALEQAKQTGYHFVSAFEDPRIMAANGGSIAHEIFEDMPDINNILFPVGGGGLGSGISYYYRQKKPSVQLIGCQHEKSPGLALSLKENKAQTALPGIETIAGGLEGGIGKLCFEFLKDRTKIALASEREIENAFKWILDKHQYLIEPTAAVTIACCLNQSIKPLKGKTTIVLTGRNVSLSTLKKVMTHEYFLQKTN